MKKQVVTFEQLVDMAINTPDSAVNFVILHRVLKLLTRYCCKSDYSFEIDTDNWKGDVTVMGKRSRSSISIGGKSYKSIADSGRSYTSDEHTQTEIKMEKDVGAEHKEKVENKTERDSQGHSTEQKDHGISSDTSKQSESGSEKKRKHDEGSKGGKHSEKEDKDKKEKKREKEREEEKKKKDKSKRKSTERHTMVSSDENIRKKEGHEESNKHLENRTNELETQIKELTERIEGITQIITTHLTEEHLAVINEEIEKLKKNVDTTGDQCFEITNTINDQATHIQDIVATINDIQLRKVENEELIDLLSGKADHSFVNEKVSISQFDEIVQGLNDVINEGSLQLDIVRQETNASLDDIRQDLLTKLLAEEFDEAKTKIYRELISLTEKHDLILAQQNEHVAAGAKMRNLNCFVCNNDVVMLLEQEIIPKFRPLKASLQPLEPIVGSKIMIGKEAPEFKNHQLKAKDFTRTSKSPRFPVDARTGREAYVKGKNGCMYKGNVGCDCVVAMDACGKMGRGNCCGTVEAMNIKNSSLTNRMNAESKNTGVGDVLNDFNKMENSQIPSQKISTDRRESKSKSENNAEPTTETKVVDEKAAFDTLQFAQSTAIPDFIEIKKEIDATIDKAASSIPNEINEHTNADSSPIDGNLTIKTEKNGSEIRTDVPNEPNNVSQGSVKVKTENQ